MPDRGLNPGYALLNAAFIEAYPGIRSRLQEPAEATPVLMKAAQSTTQEVGLGLDLGRTRLKVVAAEQTSAGLQITRALNLPLGTIGREEPVSSAVARSVRTELRRAGMRGLPAAACLPTSDAHVRLEEVGRMRDQAVLRAVIADSPLRRSEGGTDGLIAGFHKLNGDHDEERDTISIFSVVARRDAVRSLVAAVRRFGLRPGRITVPAAALFNAWSACGKAHGGTPLLLVHGGESGVLFVLVRDEHPVAAHFAALHVDLDGVSVAADVISRISQEARRTIGAVSQRWNAPDAAPAVAHVLVSGELAAVTTITAALGERLDATTEVFDPFVSLALDRAVLEDRPVGPDFVLAVGMAAESIFEPHP